MKLFACSDLHGNRQLMKRLKLIAPEVDAIIVCGDIGGKDIHNKTMETFSKYQKKSAKFLDDELSKLLVPSWFILGNDDWFEIECERYLKEISTIGNYNVMPFEYVPITPFQTNREVNENKMTYELGKLQKFVTAQTIMVAHAPPYGVGDLLKSGKRCGSPSIKKIIETAQPRLWLCGHIHENDVADYIGNTLVVNCACDYTSELLRGYIIDLEYLKAERVWV